MKHVKSETLVILRRVWFVLLAVVLFLSTQALADNAVEKIDEKSSVQSNISSLIPELDWDFHGRLAVLPLQNKGDKQFDWVSIAIQDALTQDFWHVEAFDTRSLRTFSSKFTELCPKLDLHCVVTQPATALHKTLSDQFLSYAVSGEYQIQDNQIKITLNWAYARDTSDALPGSEQIVVTSTLKNLTDDLSQSLLKWVKDRGIEVSPEHAARFERSKSHNISALKTAAAGYWLHQGYYLNKKDQGLITQWEELLIKATKADTDFSQAWNHLGWLYLNIGKKEKALHAFSKSVGLNDTTFDAQGGVALTQPDTAEGKENALKLMQVVAGFNRGNLVNQNNLGWEFTNRNLHQKALPVRLRELGLTHKIFENRSIDQAG